jgi:hypothetical protein
VIIWGIITNFYIIDHINQSLLGKSFSSELISFEKVKKRFNVKIKFILFQPKFNWNEETNWFLVRFRHFCEFVERKAELWQNWVTMEINVKILKLWKIAFKSTKSCWKMEKCLNIIFWNFVDSLLKNVI